MLQGYWGPCPLIPIKQMRRKTAGESARREKGMSGIAVRGTREYDALGSNSASSGSRPSGSQTRAAPPGRRVSGAPFGEFKGQLQITSRKIACTSRGPAVNGPRPAPIRKKIIGHDMAVCGQQFFGPSGLRTAHRRFFLVLEEPARQHGAGIFLQPLIEQRADFLPEIGSMTETGEFIALQRVPRGREEELPGRLCWGTCHRRLQEELLDRSILVTHVNGTQRIAAVENCGKFSPADPSLESRLEACQVAATRRARGPAAGIRACSACAGDYEDPDRTAWRPEASEDDQDERAPRMPAEEFPAEK